MNCTNEMGVTEKVNTEELRYALQLKKYQITLSRLSLEVQDPRESFPKQLESDLQPMNLWEFTFLLTAQPQLADRKRDHREPQPKPLLWS